MIDNNNIFPIQSDFGRIKKQDENGSEYWTSRELCTALGYSTYSKFNRTLTKLLPLPIRKVVTLPSILILRLRWSN